MERINKKILGILVVMLIGISTNAVFGYKIYDIRDYVIEANYEIDTTRYVSGNFTIYMENNETIRTTRSMENCNGGFSGCPTKYSRIYRYGEAGLGGKKHYIIVYDGTPGNGSVYDRIMVSGDKDFSNDRFHEWTDEDKEIAIGREFTLSGKTYRLLSIRDNGTTIVLKPIFSINVSRLNDTLNRAHSLYFQKFAKAGDFCECVDVIVLSFRCACAGMYTYDPAKPHFSCARRIYIDAHYIANSDTNLCLLSSHEYAHRFHDCIGTLHTQDKWNREGFAEYVSAKVCNSTSPFLWNFEVHPDVTLPWKEYNERDREANRRQYGVAYLFYVYLSDRFGENIIRRILHSTGEGTGIISSSINMSFDNIFNDFVLANYFGTRRAPNPNWNYSTVDIRVNLKNIPLDDKYYDTLNPYAADYYEIENEAGAVEVKFNAIDKFLILILHFIYSVPCNNP